MKLKIFTLLAVVCSTAAISQVPQVPLIEHFTQASCAPCASQNPTLYNTLNAFGTANYVKVTHQVSWPGYDPMYEFFPDGPDDRVSYYNISGVPNVTMNGGAPGAPNTVVTNSTLTTASANTTPYDITVTHSWPTTSSIDVSIDVENVTGSPISDADKIYVVMVEEHVSYPTPPGSNGETDFFFVMREMYNATTGAAGATTGAALGTIAANSTQTFNFTISSLPSYISDKTEVAFAVFVQKNSTKQVYQSGKSVAGPVPGLVDVEAAGASVAATGYCDYSFTPAVDFTNNDGVVAATSVVAQYTLNGGTAVQQAFTGNLTQGQSTTITFPAITLSPGTSVIEYELVSVNGGQDWASNSAVAMEAEIYNKLSATGTPAPVSEGFETAVLESGTGYSREVSTGFFEAPAAIASNNFGVVDGPAYSYGSHGGFGNSDRLVRARLYSISSGNVMSFVLDKVNLGPNSVLTFSHAYRSYSGENDNLKVRVSTDCGATWSNVFDQSGATLATLSPSTSAYNSPGASDWRSNTVDLSAYNNMNDVIIKFQITSAYGNNMFIDDINVVADASSVEETELSDFTIYPNPAVDNFTIALGNTGQSEIQILDIQGKVISTQVVSGTSKVLVGTANFEAGLYTVIVKNDNGVSMQKVIIK